MDLEHRIVLTGLQASVLEHLGIGRANAIRREDLQKRMGIDERKMREVIETLRREGYLILVGGNKPFGYYLADTQAEVDECIEYFRSRVKNEYRTYKSLKIASKKKFTKSFGQISLFK